VLEETLVIANNAWSHCTVNTLVQTAATAALHDHLEHWWSALEQQSALSSHWSRSVAPASSARLPLSPTAFRNTERDFLIPYLGGVNLSAEQGPCTPLCRPTGHSVTIRFRIINSWLHVQAHVAVSRHWDSYLVMFLSLLAKWGRAVTIYTICFTSQ
jgi:hypothetical protein